MLSSCTHAPSAKVSVTAPRVANNWIMRTTSMTADHIFRSQTCLMCRGRLRIARAATQRFFAELISRAVFEDCLLLHVILHCIATNMFQNKNHRQTCPPASSPLPQMGITASYTSILNCLGSRSPLKSKKSQLHIKLQHHMYIFKQFLSSRGTYCSWL